MGKATEEAAEAVSDALQAACRLAGDTEGDIEEAAEEATELAEDNGNPLRPLNNAQSSAVSKQQSSCTTSCSLVA